MPETTVSRSATIETKRRSRNMGKADRALSAMLAAYILTKRRSKKHGAGKAIAVASGVMFIKRAATGHSMLYDRLGINSAELERGGGLTVERSITVMRPREEIYAFLRDLTNLPLIFTHLASVTVMPHETTHWVLEGPANTHVEWDVRIMNERKNEFIAWESVQHAIIQEAGSVHLRDAGERGTEVSVKFRYSPPGGGAGAAVARILNPATTRQVGADLRTLKRVLETGADITTEGQPTGPAEPRGKRRQMRPAGATVDGGDVR